MKSQSRTPREIRGALIGTLLGDSWIASGRTFGCQQVSRPLIELKADLLSHYTKVPPKVFTLPPKKNVTIYGRGVNTKESYVVRADHPRFRKWYVDFYRTGTKQVSSSILRKLTEEGIALWFMDDGYLDLKKTKHTRNLRLCTDNFDDWSIEAIQLYFLKELNIDSKVYMHSFAKDCVKSPRVSFNASNSQKLVPIISPFMLDEFLYKVDLCYKEDTLRSKRCSCAYVESHICIKQRMARFSSGEDIV